MTSSPFGFSPAPGSGDPGDLAGKIPLFAELQRLLASGGPVNWELARQVAIAGAASADREVTTAEGSDLVETVRLADLWLDDATVLPAGVTHTEAWTRVRWVEQTLATWSTLCDPVASRVIDAMRTALPADAAEAAGPLVGVMSQIGGLMFGVQVGTGLGSLSAEVLSSTDIGVPLGPVGTAALIPANVDAFGAGLGVPAAEVRLYLALREAAHHRLFGHVAWLRQTLLDAIDAYARGIAIDENAIERAMHEIDPANPESIQQAFGGGFFATEATESQQAALARLETLLALIEGWVDDVVDQAAAAHLPGAAALRETVRRRRAAGGPAEQTFSTLVGLELRPRRLREAAAVWRGLAQTRGVEGRDAVWSHPDLLPGADALDDPEAFVSGVGDAPLLPPTEPDEPSD